MFTRKRMRLLLIFLIVSLAFSLTQLPLIGAPLAEAANGVDDLSAGIFTTVTQLLTILITAMNVLMWVLFHLIDALLDPQIIFGDLSPDGDSSLLDMLNGIWQLSRDLMNVIFALLLIAGAIYTIVLAKGDTVKEKLPKFIMAVIFVNFSWFVPRVAFDIANVLTASVFQIPSILDNFGTCQVPRPPGEIGPAGLPCKIVTDVKFLDDVKDIKSGEDGWECQLVVCIQFKYYDAVGDIAAHKKIINGLIINFARLRTLAQVGITMPSNTGGDATIPRVHIMFLLKVIIILVIHIGLFFPMLAIAIALLIRIPVLWVTMAFMPFAFLGFVIGDKLGPIGETVGKIWKQFLSAVFLPVMIAVPMAVGFVMINAGLNMPSPPGFQNVKFPILSDVTDFWQLLWMLIAFFVLYTMVFAAIKKDEIIGKFAGGLEESGKSLGRFAMKLPLAVPMFAGPGGVGPKQTIGERVMPFLPKNLERDIADFRLGNNGGQQRTQQIAQSINAAPAQTKNEIHNHVTVAIENLANNPARAKAEIEQALRKMEPLPGIQGKNDGVDARLEGLAAATGKALDKIKAAHAGPQPNPPPTI